MRRYRYNLKHIRHRNLKRTWPAFLALLTVIMIFIVSPETASAAEKEQAGKSFIKQEIKRDSLLIADPIRYGFSLKGIRPGTTFMMQDLKTAMPDSVEFISDWKLDTVAFNGSKNWKRKWKKYQNKLEKGQKVSDAFLDIDGYVTITAFDEGKYNLPPISVLKSESGNVDSLIFAASSVEYKTMPVDTATFKPHDLKQQFNYPITMKEVTPYLGATLLFALLVALLVHFIKKRMKREQAQQQKEPPHIIALRKLDKLRGDKFWKPEKQKLFYSEATDALREYISSRYDVDALEMTTPEIIAAMKDKDLIPDLYEGMKELFQRADYVKFAKYVAADEENAKVLPFAVRFVTTTYQSELADSLDSEEKDVAPLKSSKTKQG